MKAIARQSSVDDAGQACDNYRIDMAATRFGDCKCGFPKAAHTITTSAAPARPSGGSGRVKAIARQSSVDDAGQACDNYRIDMAAARFGDCKCGFPKVAHKAPAAAPQLSKTASAAAKALERIEKFQRNFGGGGGGGAAAAAPEVVAPAAPPAAAEAPAAEAASNYRRSSHRSSLMRLAAAEERNAAAAAATAATATPFDARGAARAAQEAQQKMFQKRSSITTGRRDFLLAARVQQRPGLRRDHSSFTGDGASDSDDDDDDGSGEYVTSDDDDDGADGSAEAAEALARRRAAAGTDSRPRGESTGRGAVRQRRSVVLDKTDGTLHQRHRQDTL